MRRYSSEPVKQLADVVRGLGELCQLVLAENVNRTHQVRGSGSDHPSRGVVDDRLATNGTLDSEAVRTTAERNAHPRARAKHTSRHLFMAACGRHPNWGEP